MAERKTTRRTMEKAAEGAIHIHHHHHHSGAKDFTKPEEKRGGRDAAHREKRKKDGEFDGDKRRTPARRTTRRK